MAIMSQDHLSPRKVLSEKAILIFYTAMEVIFNIEIHLILKKIQDLAFSGSVYKINYCIKTESKHEF